MAKTVQTICVTLEPSYIDILQKIKKKEKKESMSATFRFLLDWNEQKEIEAEWKRQYDEYYAEENKGKPASAKATAGKRGAR